jgi:uncharacterized protein YndB with AHSA1/START domain
MSTLPPLTVKTTVNAPLEQVWQCWTAPEHIMRWAFASNTWEAPRAENDVKVGGKFFTTMAAKDGSAKFDFTGTYTVVEMLKHLEYDMDDMRHVTIRFEQTPGGVEITEIFDPESENSLELQQSGWQSILENFRKYVENLE